MNVLHRLSIVAAAAIAAGCSNVNPPLLFGDQSTFGVHLGNDSAAAGASVSVGFKQRSVAVVPVTVLGDDGKAFAIKAHGQNDNRDALSVFAVFDGGGGGSSSGGTGSQSVRMGQMFSTGLAAQSLTRGYQCLYHKDTVCAPPAPASAVVATPVGTAQAATVAALAPANAAPADASDRPYQRPLVYMRSDVVGFDIGGSAAEQGAQFTFGYSGRNLAMIPVASLGAGGKTASLSGQESPGSKSKDTYSVFGQFKSSTETARLGFGLERFFATGVAAQNLADGVQELIAKGESKSTQPSAGNNPLEAVHTAAKH